MYNLFGETLKFRENMSNNRFREFLKMSIYARNLNKTNYIILKHVTWRFRMYNLFDEH